MISIGAGEFFYYCFWGILFAAKGVGLEYGQKVFWLCIFAALFFLVCKLILTRHTVKEWIVILLLVLWGMAIYLNSGEPAALAAALVIVGMKGIPVRRLMKVSLGIWCLLFPLSFILGYFHIRDGVVVVHEKLGLGPVIRWSLGYTHPNVLHISYFILVALLLFVCEFKGKELMAASAALFLGNLIIFLWSISYTGVLLVAGYLVLNFYLQRRKKLGKGERFLLQCIFPFCVIFPLAGPFVLKGRAFDFFNKLLSTRFELVYRYFQDFPVSLLGTGAHYENVTARLTLDSSFAYLLMYYGLLAFLVFCAGYFLLIRRLLRSGRRKALAMVVSIAVAGVTEQFLFNLSFKNLSFFFLGEYLFELLSRDSGIGWLERETGLLPKRECGIVLTDIRPYLRDAFGSLKRRARWILPAMVAAALLAGGICAVTVTMPDSVYVNRWIADYRDVENEVLLDMSKVPEDFNSLVLGYDGPEVGMYCLKGNIITLEYVRAVTGAAVLGGGSVWLLCLGAGLVFAKKEKATGSRQEKGLRK